MSDPLWTILIPTLGQRTGLFSRLMSVLMPQVDAADGRVKVLAWFNNGEPGLPHIRQGLVMATETDYMSFVDDDDLVPAYFVEKTLDAMEQKPDYVGWKTRYYVDGVIRALVVQGLHVGHKWYSEGNTLYRDVTHINPCKTKLAKLADFRNIYPERIEDRAWVRQMRPHLKEQVFIDEIMYYYYYSPKVSAWENPSAIQSGPFDRVRIDSPHFAYHPLSA